MKRKILSLFLIALVAITTTDFPVFASAAGKVTAYSAPKSLPTAYSSGDFTVTAGGAAIDLYNGGLNAWNNAVSFGYFDFSGGSIDVSITVNFSFSTFKLVPDSLGITGTKSGNTITFSISNPCNVTLVLDGNYQGRVLHLFAEAPETDTPSPTDPNVIYYGPGYYDITDQIPTLISSGKTLYIAGGAVVRGRFYTIDSSDVTFRGKGILLFDYQSTDGYNSIPLQIYNSSNVKVRDLIICRGGNSGWNAAMQNASDVSVTGYKVVSPHYASTDGFNILNSHDITFDNVFIHSSDDAVALKGTTNAGYNPSANPANYNPVYNITYKNSQLWSYANNAIGIGAETEAQYFDNIHFSNIDILYSFDDRDHEDQLTDRSAINIFALNGTAFSNISFDEIRVEKAKRLINIEMHDSFWFNQLLGSWEWPGSMSGITYNNITSTSDGTNEIRVTGWDSSHQISNVNFNNIKINGTYLTGFHDSRFKINQFASNLHINYPGGSTVNLAQGPAGLGSVYNAAAGFGTTQGSNGWYYRTWAAGIGTYNMIWNPDSSNHWRGSNTYDAIWNNGEYVTLHPDDDQAMLEWQAPHAGTVSVSGTVKKHDIGGGDGVNVSVWKNGNMVWPYTGSWKSIAYNDNTGYSHNFLITVETGDTISFRVDQRGNSANDSTSWTPTLTYQSPDQDSEYTASSGFSTVQGKNYWYYRVWAAGVGTSNMVWNPDGSNHWRGPNTYDGIWLSGGSVYMHPDNDQVMLEWQAPKTGSIKIQGTVKKFDTGGDGVNVSIWKNGYMIWPFNGSWQTINYNDTVGVNHDVYSAVTAGDVISFRVDPRNNSGYDTTYWSPSIHYQN